VLTPRLPWPLDDGGRIALWQTVWSLAQEWDTTLLSLVPESEVDRPLPPDFAAIGVEVVRVAHRPPPGPLAAIRGALGRWPYMLVRYRNDRFDTVLRQLVAERRPALALVNHLHMATYLDALGGTPAVLRAHNLEHLWLERYAARLANPLTRAYATHQVRRTEEAERELFARCCLVLPMQDGEAAAIRALAPATHVETLTVGVDFGRFRPHAPVTPPVVLLPGSWDWPPNADGAAVFLAQTWPRVRELLPEARLRVVGKRLTPALAAAARRAGGEPVGYVDDMGVEFARATVMAVPLWQGSGVRVKIIEGLAAGVPVASTPIGAEGLGLEDGVHLTLAESPEDLGDAIAALVRDPARAAATAAAGQAYAHANFSLEAIGQRMVASCRAALAARS
jgi:glycosyltransferase involved in cell wall biosynthesis